MIKIFFFFFLDFYALIILNIYLQITHVLDYIWKLKGREKKLYIYIFFNKKKN